MNTSIKRYIETQMLIRDIRDLTKKQTEQITKRVSWMKETTENMMAAMLLRELL